MKIGYPCMNLSIQGRGNKTFRLSSYSEERLIATVDNNLSYLSEMLEFNVAHRLFFFRISSDIVPFASHPVCELRWQERFAERLRSIGNFIKTHAVRISMHPDQFTLINSLDERVFLRSVSELEYHAEVLDLMGLGRSAKIQIHVGGVYGDKKESLKRFVERYIILDSSIKKRLVIENDDRLYNLRDCLWIHSKTSVPILLDSFHHEINNSGETLRQAMQLAGATWRRSDGIPMVDYSSQEAGQRRGSHARTIDRAHFEKFLAQAHEFDFDLMLEIKDKEKSALAASEIVSRNEL